MSLFPIDPDPEPTDTELDEIIRSKLTSSPPKEAYVRARLLWGVTRDRGRSDAFLVPFADSIKVYPDGAKDYAAYLESPRWKDIRERVIEAAAGKCACCAGRATAVHHRDYRPRVLRGDDDRSLVALCRNCHRKIDKLSDGKARQCWNDKEAILAEMVRKENARIAALAMRGRS